MRKRNILLSTAAILVLVSIAIAIVPPPPANQLIGIYDTSENYRLTNGTDQSACRECHNSGVPDRHHNLVPTGEYSCNNCHPVQTGPSGQYVLLDRSCQDCHNGTAFYANPSMQPGRPHHNTSLAQVRDCKFCHGGYVDNYNDGHYVPTYNFSNVTPSTTYKVINQTTGKKWGGCEACHETDLSATPWPILYAPVQNNVHHNTIIGVTSGFQCEYCHLGASGNPQYSFTIRSCEDCHSVSTIHNIQYNYAGTNGQKGWGHIGDNWDCNGCHAWFVAGESGFEGAIIPNLISIEPTKLNSSTPTIVTLNGADFLSGTGTYTAEVLIDGTTTLIPTSVTDTQVKVNVNLPAGAHTIKVIKNGDFVPKPSKLFSLTVVVPVDAVTAKITKKATKTQPAEITITGTGFGPQPDPLTDPLYNEHGVTINVAGKTVSTTVKSWSETKIVVTTPKTNIGNLVTVKAIPGQDTVNIG